MTKGKKIALFSVVSVIGLVGAYLYTQYNYAKKMCFSVGNFKVKNASVSNVSMGLDLRIKNLDNLSISIGRVRLSVYANNRFIADIDSSEMIEIKPKASSKTELNIALNPKQFISDGADILSSMNYKNISLSFKGKVSAKKFGVPFNIPIDITSKIGELMSGSDGSDC